MEHVGTHALEGATHFQECWIYGKMAPNMNFVSKCDFPFLSFS